jgi:hypothetical protein
MRVVAVVLLVLAAVVAGLALWLAIATAREYGSQQFWAVLAWGIPLTLVPLVPGVLLLRRSRRRRGLN